MVGFDQAAALAWVGSVVGLTAAQRVALWARMEEDEYDGADLALAKPKRLLKLLSGSEAEGAVPLLLTARDARLAAEEAAVAAALAATVAAAEVAAAASATEHSACIICLEPYSAAGGVVPRVLVTCGHSFCEACLDTMLRPLPAKKGRKRLECPTCRKGCAVKGGRAAKLPTNWDMMGA
jgi:hypothetical protein